MGSIPAVRAILWSINMTETVKMINKLDAWKKGKNPWVTFETDQKNMPFKRMRANEVWGDPRTHWADVKKKDKSE